MQLTHDLELFPVYTVTQLLFRDVKNATELRKMAVNGEIKGALINPSMVRARNNVQNFFRILNFAENHHDIHSSRQKVLCECHVLNGIIS